MKVRALVKLFIDGAIRKPGEEFHYDGPRRDPKQLEIVDRVRKVAPPRASKISPVMPATEEETPVMPATEEETPVIPVAPPDAIDVEAEEETPVIPVAPPDAIDVEAEIDNLF